MSFKCVVEECLDNSPQELSGEWHWLRYNKLKFHNKVIATFTSSSPYLEAHDFHAKRLPPHLSPVSGHTTFQRNMINIEKLCAPEGEVGESHSTRKVARP